MRRVYYQKKVETEKGGGILENKSTEIRTTFDHSRRPRCRRGLALPDTGKAVGKTKGAVPNKNKNKMRERDTLVTRNLKFKQLS